MSEQLPRLAAIPPVEEWFPGIESPHNRKGYLRDVSEFMSFAGLDEPKQLLEATPERVGEWRDALLDRPLKAATVRRKLSALSSLFEDLLSRGAALRNPIEGIERPGEKGDTKAAPVLTGEQARRLLDAPPKGALKGRRDRAILAVLLYQGLTREELCGLRVGDLRIRDGALHLQVTGNRGRVRTAAVHSEAGERVADYLKQAGHGAAEAASLFRPVTNNRGGGGLDRGLDPGSVYRNVVCYYAARSGLADEVKGLCAHSLRATAASTALREGAGAEAVRDWLGHSNLAATALYFRRPASGHSSPTFRISYPKFGPVGESGEARLFSAGAPPGESAGNNPSGPDPAVPTTAPLEPEFQNRSLSP